MGTISKEILAGSGEGKPIKISQTASPGTIVHITGTSDTTIDEVWIYATNSDSETRNLTIEWGGTGSDNEITVGIPSKSGLSIVIPGLVIAGDGLQSSNVRAYASTTNVINVVGYVNRMVP